MKEKKHAPTLQPAQLQEGLQIAKGVKTDSNDIQVLLTPHNQRSFFSPLTTGDLLALSTQDRTHKEESILL